MSNEENCINKEKEMKVQTERKNSKGKLMNIIKAVINSLIFVFNDFVSFGYDLFGYNSGIVKGSKELSKIVSTLSFFSFFVTTGVSMLVYGICSSIKTSIIAGTVMETRDGVKKMGSICHELVNDALPEASSQVVASYTAATTLFCTFFGTTAFALVSVFVYRKKIGSGLKNLPSLAIFAIMGTVGFAMLTDPYTTATEMFSSVKEAENYKEVYFSYLVAVYVLAALVYYLDVTFSFSYLLPCVTLGITVLVNVADKAGLITDEYRTVFFPSRIETDVSTVFIFKDEKTTGFCFKIFFSCLMNCFGTIFSCLIFNLIHINVNVPAFVSATSERVDLNVEWFVQGLANFFCSFTGYPSYFVNCYSVYLHKIGARERLGTFLSGLSLLSLFLGIPYLMVYVPNVAGQILMGYLGISFIKDYLLDHFFSISGLDKSLLVVGLVLGIFTSPALGFCFTISAVCLIILKTEVEWNRFNQIVDINILSDPNVVRIPYSATFLTKDRFSADLSLLKAGSTLDLSDCPYFDFDGNMLLDSVLNEIGIINVIGKPVNFYKSRFKSRINQI